MADTEQVLPLLETVVIVGLIFLSGIASCLSLWALPLIMLDSNSSRNMIAQFNETIRRGAKFLQPTSRLLALLLFVLAVTTWRCLEANISNRWKLYAIAGLVIAQVAWYEVVFIFPINDDIKALDVKLGSTDKELSSPDRKKLILLLKKWQQLQWGRTLMAFAAGFISFTAVRN